MSAQIEAYIKIGGPMNDDCRKTITESFGKSLGIAMNSRIEFALTSKEPMLVEIEEVAFHIFEDLLFELNRVGMRFVAEFYRTSGVHGYVAWAKHGRIFWLYTNQEGPTVATYDLEEIVKNNKLQELLHDIAFLKEKIHPLVAVHSAREYLAAESA